MLSQVSGRLESVGKRDDLMIESINNVDRTLGTLNSVNEKSINTLESVKGAIDDLKSESKKSASRYESVIQKMQDQETENLSLIQKIQRRTLWVKLLLGVGLIVSLIILVMDSRVFL